MVGIVWIKDDSHWVLFTVLKTEQTDETKSPAPNINLFYCLSINKCFFTPRHLCLGKEVA